MSVAIATDTQASEITSGLIHLYEIELGTGTNNKLYFHSEKDLDGTDSNKDIIFDGNTYISLPIMIDNIEKKSDGAMNRPKVTIANVESLLKTGSAFKTEMSDGTWDSLIQGENITAAGFKFETLIGQRFIRRKTLEKYTGSATPVEFPKETFIVDRITDKTFISVTLELASPMELSNVRIPARVVVGKYCPWLYQEFNNDQTKSACYWKTNEQILDTEGDSYTFYFTINDEPLVFYDHFYNANGTRKTAYTSVISRVAIVNAGSGYTSAPTVTISAPSSGTTATATATISAGKVTGVSITNAGTGYDAAATVTFSGAPSGGTTATGVVHNSIGIWKADYSSSTSYVAGHYVYSNTLSNSNTVGSDTWRAEGSVSGVTPAEGSASWQTVRTYTTWNNSTTYTVKPHDIRQNSYVRYTDNNVYRAVKENTNVAPGTDGSIWVRADACGKLLKSCKIRYQALPSRLVSSDVKTNSIPAAQFNSVVSLPFGGFPGSKKFR